MKNSSSKQWKLSWLLHPILQCKALHNRKQDFSSISNKYFLSVHSTYSNTAIATLVFICSFSTQQYCHCDIGFYLLIFYLAILPLRHWFLSAHSPNSNTAIATLIVICSFSTQQYCHSNIGFYLLIIYIAILPLRHWFLICSFYI